MGVAGEGRGVEERGGERGEVMIVRYGPSTIIMSKSIFFSAKKKSGKYWGPRRNEWAGAVSGGQGQYRVGRSSIDCSTTQVGISKKL